MNEVEKMYSNVGIKSKAECTSKVCIVTNPHKDWCNKCESLKYEYPPFTAEKQLELIKWFVINNAELETLEITYYLNDCFQISSCTKSSHFETNFENAIAGLINSLWQDLTEEEQKQVRGILE